LSGDPPQVEADIGRDRLCNPGDTYAEYQAPTQLHRSSTARVDVVAQRTETVDAGSGSPDPAVESFRAPAFTHAVTETGNAQADLVTVTAYVVAEIRSTRSSRSGSRVIAILRSKTNQTGTDRELVVLPAPRGPSAARSPRFAPGARPPIVGIEGPRLEDLPSAKADPGRPAETFYDVDELEIPYLVPGPRPDPAAG
jgi:hypothetical protein